MTNKLWGGRFKKKTDPDFESFSASFRWDRRLLPYDLAIDAAHARALKKCGVLTTAETARLLSAIRLLEKKYRSETLALDAGAEDIHSAVHSALRRLTGPLADKLHTARSRNDLVSQSSRLYGKTQAARLIRLIQELQKSIVRKAETCREVLVPGMTHLQNAQVVSQAHIYLAYVEMLERAKFRFQMAQDLCDVCVLGSGALAGVTFDLDQKALARELGLSQVTRNSYDVSGDRDFVLNLLSSCAVLGTHLSRIAEDLMIGQTQGFALVELDQAFCTGSSMMPQKKNADFLELTRGASGVFSGNLSGFLVTLKGLPTSYNRDLQWDKKFLFESLETAEEILLILSRVFLTLKINKERAAALTADESLYATDVADYLVKKGVAFQAAHEQAGRLVRFAEERKLPMSKIGLDLLRALAPKLDGGFYDHLNAEHSVRLKKTLGSTHPSRIRTQIADWKKRLKN
ncbi:MAG: argininosuccinate lyase [Candidatus Omnitrophica bacterium]|nr:argininosuccinate lyase [Candidatus Omnitrophota bacterium]